MQTMSTLSAISLSWLLFTCKVSGSESESSESLSSSSDEGQGGNSTTLPDLDQDIEDLIELLGDAILPFENIVSSTLIPGEGENAYLLTTNTLLGIQSIYSFSVEAAIAAADVDLEFGDLPSPPEPIEAPICRPGQIWVTGDGLSRTLSFISNSMDSSRTDVGFSPRVDPFNFVTFIEQGSGPFTGIISDCNQNLLAISESGGLYNLKVDDIEDSFIEPELIGAFPGLTSSIPITYNFKTGEIVGVFNDGSDSYLRKYAVSVTDNEECSIQMLQSDLITPALNCGDGDISAIYNVGDTLYSVICTLGEGAEGTPNAASLVNPPFEGVQPSIRENTAMAGNELFEDITTGNPSGLIPISLDGESACPIPDDAECTDLSVCE